ncbi:hypothetical protein A3B51_02605 [Candidatus Curtissbacteria bacterium RIFCSPLOWO2_01_FULL_41_18]|uniref:CopG family transcriptional regulator n=2 Tax=Candidatus Curtissiibacteriota TaxID=1752717 RepID=A0A1F5FZ06_9BACT|nr:MAG: hypothetical protein A2696_00955 [Candidatus Curtissbacteria bacterium RIFCSPHIGHO2_01_FULL_41_13]OGE05285.1 MAG: hypothetical protein A3B51_02605 [Candidatus Curtissbacteria bacterium RIFCSPLOWO2_01_FULL_41_18]
MQNAVRTTIRIRKDLLDQSRLLAIKRGTNLQEVINSTLAKGFGHISDLYSQKQAMAKIDKFRQGLEDKNINLQKLLERSRKNLK